MDNLPIFFPVPVITKKAYSSGYLKNGKHMEQYEPKSLTLFVYDHPFIKKTCQDCGAEIQKGDIAAHDIDIYHHCVNCIVIPDNLKHLEAWKVTFRLKRKSRKHPKGTFTLSQIGTPVTLQEYFTKISMMYQQIENKTIWTYSQ